MLEQMKQQALACSSAQKCMPTQAKRRADQTQSKGSGNIVATT